MVYGKAGMGSESKDISRADRPSFLSFLPRPPTCFIFESGLHNVVLAGLELRAPPAYAPQWLGLKASVTTFSLETTLG